MRLHKIFASVMLASSVVASSAMAAEITGAGATFPYPIYAKWAEAYQQKTGVKFNYQAIGSGGGIKQIKAKTVDFGASDAPLKAAELEEYGLLQFPAIIGGVVPVINLEGFKPGQLKLSGSVLADIYMGKIKKWNDPAIQASNQGVALPDRDITVVHRSDGSGTTFLWTSYLSKVSPQFDKQVGTGKAVKWPAGVGGKGNAGIAANVQRINGSIGYVEYAYAKKNNIPYVQLKNKSGQYVKPSDATFKAAAAGAEWKKTPGFGVILTDQPGAKSWPIAGASFILMYKEQVKPEAAKAVMQFFDWSFKHGGKMATELDYVAIPPAVVKQIQAVWKKDIKDTSGKSIWK